MNIKVVNALKDYSDLSNVLTIGTHNGMFHSDEVVACAILCLLGDNNNILIVRTRNKDTLKLCDICVDVDGGKFDHHMAGFNLRRDNGILYASAGLVWNVFGYRLVDLIHKKYFSEFKIDLDEVVRKFDNEVISVVDREDNGVPCNELNIFSYIPSYRPLWFDDTENFFNSQFEKVLKITMNVLEEQLKCCMSKVLSRQILWDHWLNYDLFHDGILEIPAQSMDWVDIIIDFNDSTPCEFARINFVMFPYSDGGWAAQSVPPSHENKFAQRIPFPKAWAGQKDELPTISGVPTATFCHNGCFFVRAGQKDDVTKLCLIASDNR